MKRLIRAVNEDEIKEKIIKLLKANLTITEIENILRLEKGFIRRMRDSDPKFNSRVTRITTNPNRNVQPQIVNRKYTQDDFDKILKLLSDGYTYENAENALSIPGGTIQSLKERYPNFGKMVDDVLMQQNRKNVYTNQFSPEKIAKIIELIRQGLDDAEIEDRMFLSIGKMEELRTNNAEFKRQLRELNSPPVRRYFSALDDPQYDLHSINDLPKAVVKSEKELLEVRSVLRNMLDEPYLTEAKDRRLQRRKKLLRDYLVHFLNREQSPRTEDDLELVTWNSLFYEISFVVPGFGTVKFPKQYIQEYFDSDSLLKKLWARKISGNMTYLKEKPYDGRLKEFEDEKNNLKQNTENLLNEILNVDNYAIVYVKVSKLRQEILKFTRKTTYLVTLLNSQDVEFAVVKKVDEEVQRYKQLARDIGDFENRKITIEQIKDILRKFIAS